MAFIPRNVEKILLFVLLLVVSDVLSQTVSVDPQCSKSRVGLPACDFNKYNCFKEPEGEKSWIHVPFGAKGPAYPIELGYVYLDPKISKGKPRGMFGTISGGIKAICVTFKYVTVGNTSAPINIYIQDGDILAPVHQVEAKRGGNWESTHFSCCLPDLINQKISIEATSTVDSIVSIDYVDITRSNMPCGNGELVCYPGVSGQTPLEADSSVQRCPSDQEEPAVRSCDFTPEDKIGPATCGWDVSPGWDVRQKRDGTGHYDIIYSIVEDGANLVASIDDAVDSLCAEIQFSVPDQRADPGNVFSVHIVAGNVSVLWGEAYSYHRQEEAVWRRNNFEGVLPEGTGRQIQITAAIKGLKIDYIHIKTSNMTRPTKAAAEDMKTWYILFSCPVVSADLKPPLCEMTPIPDQNSSDAHAWTEVTYPGDDIFPGRENYLLFSGKGHDLLVTPASLTTEVIKSYNMTTLSFSYALSGHAKLEIYTLEDGQRRMRVWHTKHETGRTWVRQKVDIGWIGEFQLLFLANYTEEQDTSSMTIFIGFTDIQVKVSGEQQTTVYATPTLMSNNPKEPTVKPTVKPTNSSTEPDAQTEGHERSIIPNWLDVLVTVILVVLSLLFISLIVGIVWKYRKDRKRRNRVV